MAIVKGEVEKGQKEVEQARAMIREREKAMKQAQGEV